MNEKKCLWLFWEFVREQFSKKDCDWQISCHFCAWWLSFLFLNVFELFYGFVCLQLAWLYVSLNNIGFKWAGPCSKRSLGGSNTLLKGNFLQGKGESCPLGPLLGYASCATSKGAELIKNLIKTSPSSEYISVLYCSKCLQAQLSFS